MRLRDKIIAHVSSRAPDFQIGGAADPYLNRWWVIPRNPFFNIYLHQFIRDDDDRAEHDHPWWSLSWCLRGTLHEQINGVVRYIYEGSWRFRTARMCHRLEVPPSMRGKVWTLFITGPRLRSWGFHCPTGWVPWREFTAGPNGEVVGRGCGEMS